MVDLYKRAARYFEQSRTPVAQTDDQKNALQNALKAAELNVAVRRKSGRYTLEEAAYFVAFHGVASAQSILNGLMDTIALGELDIYEPALNSKYKTNVVRPWSDEVYWSDLNNWLREHEPNIQCVFPSPVAAQTGVGNQGGVQGRGDSNALDFKENNPAKIGWQIALFSSWKRICECYGNSPTPLQVIQWLRRHDESGFIANTGADNELYWYKQRDTKNQVKKPVATKTIANVISRWRMLGIIPR